MEKKYLVAFSFLLFLPWVNVVYSYFTDELSLMGSVIPPNKCVALVKLELEKKSKLVEIKEEENKIKKKEEPTADINTETEVKQEEEKIEEEKIEEEEKERKVLKNILIVGDSLGEGLYLAYQWKISKELKDCLNIKFMVKHSTTTKTWLKNEKFFETLASGDYDTLIIVLGANEWGIDKTTLYYNINKLYMKVKEINPDIDVYWVVPSTKNEYLRIYIEQTIGKDKTIAIEDYIDEIPLSKDHIHPSMKKNGYEKLWFVILQRILAEKVLNCQK